MEVGISYTNFKIPDVETRYSIALAAPIASSVIYHFAYIYCITMPSFKKKARERRHFVAPNQACHVTAANLTLAKATGDILLSTRIII